MGDLFAREILILYHCCKFRYSSGPNTNALANALAIAQYHAAVSGTQSQHVAAENALRISKGYADASELVASSLESLTASRSSSNYEKTAGVFQQVPASEAVSITQGIAYKVQVPIDGIMRSCVFIDTPGHEAVYRTAYGHCMFRKTEENQLPWDIMLNGNEEDKLVVFRVYVKPRPSPPGRNHQYLVPSR